MTLALLISTGQLLCRLYPNLGLSKVLARLDGGYVFWTRIVQVTLCVSQCIISGSRYVLSGDVNFDHLVKVVSAGFPL